MTLQLHSSAFAPTEVIPTEYTCEGANLSPPLSWSGMPPGTRSLLVTCDDPDAPHGVFHHWALYNIPPTATGLAAGRTMGEAAFNDFGRRGYGGPCPPPGDQPHRYVFLLAALDSQLSADPRMRCAEIEALARGHVLAEAQLVGLFGR